MTMSPKRKAELQSKGELPPQPTKAETPVIGVQAVAARLERSMRTVSNWKVVYDDFPVSTEEYTGIWTSSEEALDRWKALHADLYVSHKQKLAESRERRPPLRRW
jgi:hypothetical protein